MSVIENVVIPESLFKQVRELAEKEGVSMEQFVSSAVAEKASAWLTVEYLKKRANRANRNKFEKALSKIPNVEPEEFDKFE